MFSNGDYIASKGTLKPDGTITKFGIKAELGAKVEIDGNEIVIGNSGIFEADNVVVKTISVDPTASQVMINYLYETEEI